MRHTTLREMMDLDKFKYFLIIDVEATCCKDNSFPVNEMEMIEIGAVLICADSLTKLDEFSTFIQPQRHPKLTDFCTNLTTITQHDVDHAPYYPEAINTFQKWLGNYDNYLFCSWGEYDKQQFEQDCAFHNVPYPIPAPHLNIKKQFSKTQKVRKRQGMAGALKLAKIPFSGSHHRGIDDANNMIKLIPYVMGRVFIDSQKKFSK